MTEALSRIPYVEGIVTAEQVAETAASIAAMQEDCGSVPWTTGEHTDVWNHVEAAMAMLVGGQAEAAERAYAWVPTVQRADGSVPMKIVDGVVEDPRGEVNMSAYLAVGVWHHWLVRRDAGFVQQYWPTVRAGLDWVVSQQLPFGGLNWTPTESFALLAGCSSIYHSLRAGVALADLLDDPQPEWELAGGRLGHALREHRDLFADKSTYSMDWYYPVLGGAVRGRAAFELLESRWEEFVVPGLGIHCVDSNPWVTGAETCELAMALDGLGDHRRGRARRAAKHHQPGPAALADGQPAGGTQASGEQPRVHPSPPRSSRQRGLHAWGDVPAADVLFDGGGAHRPLVFGPGGSRRPQCRGKHPRANENTKKKIKYKH